MSEALVLPSTYGADPVESFLKGKHFQSKHKLKRDNGIMSAPTKMRNWCFTKYDLSMPDFEDKEDVRYCVWQHEICPDSGREHIQGYIELKKSIRINAVKRLFNDNTMHLERRAGTRDQARAYCMKEESRKVDTLPEEYGDWEQNRGKRNDLEEVYDAIGQGKSVDEIAELYPIKYMRYSRAIKDMVTTVRSRNEVRAILDDFESAALRPWQEETVEALEAQNDREVLWVTDQEGGKGKSFLTKYLNLKKDAFVVTGGNSNDIAYEYNFQKMVVFDLARETEYMPYQLIENFKNGLIFSPKYESRMKYSKNVKVVIFSNFPPNLNKLSADRWVIKNI